MTSGCCPDSTRACNTIRSRPQSATGPTSSSPGNRTPSAINRSEPRNTRRPPSNSKRPSRAAPTQRSNKTQCSCCAESYFFADDYIHARDAYDELVKEYANTRYMDTVIDREWKIARYWEEKDAEYHHYELTPNMIDKTRPWFDTIGHAIKTYESIRLNDPTGPRADDAIMATANIYFRYGQFEEADYNYTLLRREYPRSELQFEAHLLGLQAKLRKYQGQDYDGAPLEEAKTLVKQLNSQFSGRLSKEEKDHLGTVEGQLTMEIANRDYRMAAYYDYKQDYGAAKFYYAQVIKKYPNTEVAKKSTDRVAAIKGLPDEPAKKLAFLVELAPRKPRTNPCGANSRIAERRNAPGSSSG